VRVAVEGARVVVEVADDGKGFTPTGRESGLANMRRRAHDVGGVCDIRSAPDEGTTVWWAAPLSPAETEEVPQ
jgi:signal transduction histidine kinase